MNKACWIAGDDVSRPRFAFALWLAENVEDPTVLDELQRAFKYGFRGNFSVTHLNDFVNGNRYLSKKNIELVYLAAGFLLGKRFALKAFVDD